MPDPTKSQQPKLLDQVRQVLRLHHYSIHTERSYVDWIVRFVRFHSMRSREHLFPAEATVQKLLGHANVATTMIYTHVLNRPGISVYPVRKDVALTPPFL
jgi:integrase